MFYACRSSSSATHSNRSRAFTLIELLVVLGVIFLLTGLALGSLRGAKNQAASSRARGELSVLAQALEGYRQEYGEYPLTADTPGKLYAALCGRTGPTSEEIAGRNLVPAGSRISLLNENATDGAANCYVDPWGRPYQYVHFTRDAGIGLVKSGYVLFSFGVREGVGPLPTREEVVPALTGETGGSVAQTALTARNIYANK